MGSIGANKGTTVIKGAKQFEGKSFTELYDAVSTVINENGAHAISSKKVREVFGLEDASVAQITSLIAILNGIREYDRGYDENKTPYTIRWITVEPIGSEISQDMRDLGMRQTKRPISVNIWTEPTTDSAYLRMTDAKEHDALIGANGGLFTYTDKGKRKTLKMFDVRYGRRTFK